MKRLLLSLFVLGTLSLYAEPFYVRVNGTTDYAATATGEQDYQGRTQYLTSNLYLQQGDIITVYDAGSSVAFAISSLDPYGAYTNFTASSSGITCNTDSCYDIYIKLKYADDLIYIGYGTGCTTTDPEEPETPETPDAPNTTTTPADYESSVPSQCPDVMLQAFYWDSNTDQGYGNTKWSSLNAQASEISAYFDLVWLPPSAKSSGGVGYLPSQYSNQNSAWGTRTDLETFITAMHAGGTKVIADIVINHANNKSTWCDYYPLDFGSYGTFEPNASWISSSDEVWSSGQSNCTKGSGAQADDGYGSEANYAAARDWDHQQSQVREMCRAYLKWMKNEMKFDGWRYDYCKGFHGSHINDYNSSAKNYFSVTEYWDGNASVLQSYLNDAGYNTLTFDFGTKYAAFNNGIASNNYAGCQGCGLLGAGKSKYAVTFVDSHDTFARDNNEMCGKGNSMKYPEKILQANAFMLSMPGVPCVFYPHWVSFKEEIGAMVLARQATGVHSESSVSDEAGSGYYKATITGTNGSIKLFLGPNSGYSTCPSGYTKAAQGTNYGVYYKINSDVAPKLIVSPGNTTFKDANAGLTITMKTIGGSSANIIYYTLDGSTPSTESTQYTAPIVVKETTTLKAFAVNGSKKTAMQTYTYTYKAPQTTPITVSFYKPNTWTKVNIYSWTGSGTAVTKYTGAWPGTTITTNDNGWYRYTFDSSLKEINFIFNNGSDQTGDLYTDEDVCYSWSGGAEKLEPSCTITDVKEITVDNSLTIYPNPVAETLNIKAAKDMTEIEIVSFTGQRMMSLPLNSTDAQISVSDLQQGLYLIRIQLKDNTITTNRFIKR